MTTAKRFQTTASAPLTSILLTLSVLLSACGGNSNNPEPFDSVEPVSEPVDNNPYPVRVLDVTGIEDQVLIEEDTPIIMRDGVRLSARVFRPSATGNYPVIMAFTSYGKDKGPDEYPPVLDFSEQAEFDMGRFYVSPWTTWEGPDPAHWVPLGYAVVYVDVRGYYNSEGTASVLSEQERLDFYDAIEWAGSREWSNGNVGLSGVSYLAISQWVAAGGSPPANLKAILPWEGQTDSFREVLYHGGIPETAFTSYWVDRVNNGANTPPLPALADFQVIHKNPQIMRAFQPPQAVDPATVSIPALICASWSDHGLHTRGSFEAYKDATSQHKWLYTHGQPKWSTYYGEEALAMQQRFFDYFLKGVDNGMDEVQAVRLEVRETIEDFQVRYEDSWPIARTEYQKLFLDTGSKTLKGSAQSSDGSIDYDPIYEDASFTYQFEADTEITGNMKLKLWVSSSEGEDMDLFVGIQKLDSNGVEVPFYAKTGYTLGPVAMGWLRVSERALDADRSTEWQPYLSHDEPAPIEAGEIVAVEVEILPSSTLFRAGESLRIVVQGRDLFEHPALAHEHSAEINVGVHSIYSGLEFDSHLLIPVIPAE